MGYLNHYTGTVACLVSRLGSSVLHVLQYLQCIVHQFMALSAVDIHNHTYTTRVMLILALIQSLFLSLKFAF